MSKYPLFQRKFVSFCPYGRDLLFVLTQKVSKKVKADEPFDEKLIAFKLLSTLVKQERSFGTMKWFKRKDAKALRLLLKARGAQEFQEFGRGSTSYVLFSQVPPAVVEMTRLTPRWYIKRPMGEIASQARIT